MCAATRCAACTAGPGEAGSDKRVGIRLDSLISAAARALAAGDPLGALERVALRDDPAALALRGIAMAQLGDLERAAALLRRAARSFGPAEEVARARCVVALAEIALASRDLSSTDALKDAQRVLQARGDALNAAHAQHLMVRRLLLIGALEEAERALSDLDERAFPPAWRAAYELAVAGLAMRRLRSQAARTALAKAERAASAAGIAALSAEVAALDAQLDAPAARCLSRGGERLVSLADIEALLASDAIVIDACRLVIRSGGGSTVLALGRRPVLFALARALGEAWPSDASRADLLARAFGAKRVDASHRARLRVEVARLRASLLGIAEVRASTQGFVLMPSEGREVVVLAPPVQDEHATLLALLADGEAWSSSALATVMGTSQRTVQRALDALAAAGKAQSFGQGRARQWSGPPLPGFTTVLLLPGPLPAG